MPDNWSKLIFFFDNFYIQLIQIGGMAKQKKKPISSKTSHPQKPHNQNTLSFSTPLAPVTQPLAGQKRKIGDLSHFIKKEQSVSPPTVQKKYFIQQFLKQKSISIQVLALQCPNFQAAILQIHHTTQIDKNLIYNTIHSYFQGTKHQLWSDKYSPKNLKQSLHKNFGQKILKWIRIYMNYRNCYPEESNSLFDYFGDGASNSEYKCMRENGWKLKGLILKGRSGVGKSTLIRATAKQMECQIFHCGNECNQIKYLKERNQATQSESVKTKINKNHAQIHKTNKTLTSFATKIDESQIQPQSKRIQFMHNVNNFYPREDEAKFFNQLNKTIESSKIPFLMTLTGENVPQSLKIYDVIEFEEASTQDIARLLFLIYHVEKSFSFCLDLEKVIEKDKFKQELNEQFKCFSFTIETAFEDFLRLVEISRKKLDFLFTFIQNPYRLSKQLDLTEAQNLMKDYLKRSNQDKLMNEYFYSSQSQILGKEQNDSVEELIDSKYLLFAENEQKIQNQSQCIESTSSNSKKQNNNKLNLNIEKQIVKIQMGHQISMIKTIENLKYKVNHDYKPQILNDESFIFNKLNNQQKEQLQQDLIQNISIYQHQQIRKKIIKNIKRQFYLQNELNTSLKPKQLCFIGFLIDSRSRVSRKKLNKQQLNLKKYLKNNQINYLKSFTQILKPGSNELKL